MRHRLILSPNARTIIPPIHLRPVDLQDERQLLIRCFNRHDISARTTQQRLHPRQQFVSAERLRHVFIRPQLQPHDFVRFRALGRQK